MPRWTARPWITTRFGGWVAQVGVPRLTTEFADLCAQQGTPELRVTRNAVYDWLHGRRFPLGVRLILLARLGEGSITETDVLQHVEAMRAHHPES